jgi:hypothetical protein
MFDKLGGIGAVQAHVASLTGYMFRALSALRHSNGAPMLKIFGKHHLPNASQVGAHLLRPWPQRPWRRPWPRAFPAAQPPRSDPGGAKALLPPTACNS